MSAELCPACKGTGRVPHGGRPPHAPEGQYYTTGCHGCDGKGWVETSGSFTAREPVKIGRAPCGFFGIIKSIAPLFPLLLIAAAPAWAGTKVCYKTGTPAAVSSVGKTIPDADETCFETALEPQAGDRREYYTIDHSGGSPVLVRKQKAEIDALDAQRQADRQAAEDKRQAAAKEVIDKLTGLSDQQIDDYIEANVTNIASAKAYLKRLTKAVRALAVAAGED